MNPVVRWMVRGIDVVNRRGKPLGARLVKVTGKRPYVIHPKHLIDDPWHDWYAPYLSARDVALDVGCSNGAHLVRAAPRCRSIVGFDYDPGQLGIALRAIRSQGLRNAQVFAWDVTGRFPFREQSFDVVLFLDVI